MYNPSTYLEVAYFPTYLPIYETWVFPTELVYVDETKYQLSWGSSTAE
jgi:hypothetical protein